MILLQTKKISKSFIIDPILSNIDLQIHYQERVGLVGVNGAGKSTLLKIIAGELTPDSGEIQVAKGSTIGYLSQDSGLESNKTIWEEMRSVFSNLIEQEKVLRQMEQKMATLSETDPEQYEHLMNDYAKISQDFQEKGGYSYEAKIRGVLHGLGFQQYDYKTTLISTLSGGQKTRLALARLLLTSPDLLVLDEPTNYLDMETLTWLEAYLKAYPGAILLVSHDRYFLDRLVTVIYEIERTKVTRYVGNYSAYIEQKAAEIEQKLKQYEKQQEEIAKLEDFIQRNIARASTTRRAQSRRKALEKMERIDRPITTQRKSYFTFDIEKQSGHVVLLVDNIRMQFEQQLLFRNVSFQIHRQDRVALIGPNGVGKSTLFKIILNQLKPISGSIKYGSNVAIGYYAQEQDDLTPEKSVLDEIWDQYPEMNEVEVRTLLGNFLFTGDDVFKKIKDLSGGEKARVALAKLMLKKANFLLLDEPTNHLDIISREVLENALVDYPGTILMISHDRYFLNRITTMTLELSQDGVKTYLGNYDYYLEKKAEEEQEKEYQQMKETEKLQRNRFIEEKERKKIERQLKRQIEEIELQIEQLEEKITLIEGELLLPEVYLDHQLAHKKNQELQQLKENLNQVLNRWETLQYELEEIL
ncbi:ABC-F family ATP-binding cassette domain-containing protein [Tepidibacillus fermentans]|uniref:ATP-binding cassette subfamily F protein 3 n=1 Tax=Tepidibacillus fermentans TaxID=1281767 RepID=A0A4R3K9C5_9BACI|nr:ABC-F type ribosomal protection protein [Tepidibacillus fermentans]TCS79570.1 ATP-binding cassette subfamily F protein 3 [Tepidibacillus fermentans]